MKPPIKSALPISLTEATDIVPGWPCTTKKIVHWVAECTDSGIACRVIPFAVYLMFLALAQGMILLADLDVVGGEWVSVFAGVVFPVQITVVLVLLWYFWPQYEELHGRVLRRNSEPALAVIVGVAVYLAWVHMDWSWATQGEPKGYNPFLIGGTLAIILAGLRVVGSTLIVPIMEELFWRSFVLRYVVDSTFKNIPLGTFSLGSFGLTVMLFGVEHVFWFAGMVAGAAYTILLYKTRNLGSCILAHATTNFLLGVHVLYTGEFYWW